MNRLRTDQSIEAVPLLELLANLEQVGPLADCDSASALPEGRRTRPTRPNRPTSVPCSSWNGRNSMRRHQRARHWRE